MPLPTCLETILDAAYHASFLRDEERPVTCRLLVLSPEELPVDGGPPDGLLPLAFEHPRRFDEHEIRRLSPAAKYHRALLGVRVAEGGRGLQTWGLLQSGPRWLQSGRGGRAPEPRMPPCLLVRILRPGTVAVSCGNHPVAELRGGRLSDANIDVFASKWMPRLFETQRAEVAAVHRALGDGTTPDGRAAALTGHVAQQLVKRILATMRSAHHGGALLILPPDCTAQRYLQPKYTFADEAPRRHFRRLLVAILGELQQQGVSDEEPAAAYRRGAGARLSELDEALFEVGHLIAALADVDGAVVLTKRFEILGFGAEIAGELPVVTEVRRALDQEGRRYVTERVDGVGTRHRSAYRLCAAVPSSLALVVSQDGGARFVTRTPPQDGEDGAVTYWDQGAASE